MRKLRRGDEGSLDAAYGERSAQVRATVADYMAASPAVGGAPSQPVTSSSGAPVGVIFHSDGAWVWTGAATDAFRSGEVDVEAEFVAHALAAGHAPSELSREQSRSAFQTMTGR